MNAFAGEEYTHYTIYKLKECCKIQITRALQGTTLVNVPHQTWKIAKKTPLIICEQKKTEMYSSFRVALDLEEEVIPESHQMKLNDIE